MIRKFLDCSTSYITGGDDKILTSLASGDPGDLPIDSTDRGYWIYVTDDPVILAEEVIPSCKAAGLSPAFRNLLLHVHNLGVPYLKLDGDGYDDLPEDFPKFEW